MSTANRLPRLCAVMCDKIALAFNNIYIYWGLHAFRICYPFRNEMVRRHLFSFLLLASVSIVSMEIREGNFVGIHEIENNGLSLNVPDADRNIEECAVICFQYTNCVGYNMAWGVNASNLPPNPKGSCQYLEALGHNITSFKSSLYGKFP